MSVITKSKLDCSLLSFKSFYAELCEQKIFNDLMVTISDHAIIKRTGDTVRYQDFENFVKGTISAVRFAKRQFNTKLGYMHSTLSDIVLSMDSGTETSEELREKIRTLQHWLLEFKIQVDTVRTADTMIDYFQKLETYNSELNELGDTSKLLSSQVLVLRDNEIDLRKEIKRKNRKYEKLEERYGKVKKVFRELKDKHSDLYEEYKKLVLQYQDESEAHNNLINLQYSGPGDRSMDASMAEPSMLGDSNNFNQERKKLQDMIAALKEQLKDKNGAGNVDIASKLEDEVKKLNEDLEKYKRERERLLEEVDQAETEIEQLRHKKQKKEAGQKAENDRLQEKLDHDLKEQKNKFNRKLEEKKEELDQIQDKLADSERKHRQEASKLKGAVQDSQEEVSQLKANLEKQKEYNSSSNNDHLDREINDLKGKVFDKEAQIKIMKEDAERKENEIQREKNSAVKKLKDEIDNLTDDHDREVRKLKQENRKLAGDLEDEVQDLNRELKNREDEHKREIEKVKKQFQIEADNSPKYQDDEVSEMLKRQAGDLNDKLKSKQREHEREAQRLNNTIESLEDKLRRQQQDSKVQSQKGDERMMEKLKEKEEDLAKEVQRLKRQIASAEEQVVYQKKQAEAERERLEGNHDSEVEALKNSLDKVEQSLKKKIKHDQNKLLNSQHYGSLPKEQQEYIKGVVDNLSMAKADLDTQRTTALKMEREKDREIQGLMQEVEDLEREKNQIVRDSNYDKNKAATESSSKQAQIHDEYDTKVNDIVQKNQDKIGDLINELKEIKLNHSDQLTMIEKDGFERDLMARQANDDLKSRIKILEKSLGESLAKIKDQNGKLVELTLQNNHKTQEIERLMKMEKRQRDLKDKFEKERDRAVKRYDKRAAKMKLIEQENENLNKRMLDMAKLIDNLRAENEKFRRTYRLTNAYSPSQEYRNVDQGQYDSPIVIKPQAESSTPDQAGSMLFQQLSKPFDNKNFVQKGGDHSMLSPKRNNSTSPALNKRGSFSADLDSPITTSYRASVVAFLGAQSQEMVSADVKLLPNETVETTDDQDRSYLYNFGRVFSQFKMAQMRTYFNSSLKVDNDNFIVLLGEQSKMKLFVLASISKLYLLNLQSTNQGQNTQTTVTITGSGQLGSNLRQQFGDRARNLNRSPGAKEGAFKSTEISVSNFQRDSEKLFTAFQSLSVSGLDFLLLNSQTSYGKQSRLMMVDSKVSRPVELQGSDYSSFLDSMIKRGNDAQVVQRIKDAGIRTFKHNVVLVANPQNSNFTNTNQLLEVSSLIYEAISDEGQEPY